MAMSVKLVFAVFFLLSGLAAAQYEYEEELLIDSFPADFKWGVATSAYQIEGGWKEGGKSPSIWDTFTAEEGHIADGSNGTVACDSYNNYAEDARLIAEMGAKYYRFSLAWTRILPDGTGETNAEGIQYYKDVIAALKANGVTPVATLYHWDLPQVLQYQDGWANPDVADWFEEYARVCFTEFGDDVKLWITLNEPYIISILGHGDGVHAPGITDLNETVYQVSHNLILSHARAYRLYESEFAETQKGEVGITLNVEWSEPKDPTDETHVEAAERSLDFSFGWYAHPIFVDGDYPAIMQEKVDANSADQGYDPSRLPNFTKAESAMVLGSSDFLGINFYTSSLVEPKDFSIEDHSYYADMAVETSHDENWYTSGSDWLKVTPFGIRKLVNWAAARYGENLPIYITENGYSDKIGNLDDMHREYYYKHYINQLLKAVVEDGVNLKGYFAWSLLDNFEWAEGYTEKFGLHRVDMESDARTRTPKESTKFLRGIFQNNGYVAGSGGATTAASVLLLALGLAARAIFV